jgi:hypothetical protein
MIKKLFALGLLSVTLGGISGCMYAGIATAPDGTLYVARNDMFLFGLLRKVYACKPAGAALVCSDANGP